MAGRNGWQNSGWHGLLARWLPVKAVAGRAVAGRAVAGRVGWRQVAVRAVAGRSGWEEWLEGQWLAGVTGRSRRKVVGRGAWPLSGNAVAGRAVPGRDGWQISGWQGCGWQVRLAGVWLAEINVWQGSGWQGSDCRDRQEWLAVAGRHVHRGSTGGDYNAPSRTLRSSHSKSS